MAAINKTISDILEKWKFHNVEDFLAATKSGKLDEGVMDAISMRQLLLDFAKYQV